jgi:hypothetical protein
VRYDLMISISDIPFDYNDVLYIIT